MTACLFLHGTTLARVPSIEREGLREPDAGRGVWLAVPSLRVDALAYAARRAIRDRAAAHGRNDHADLALVTVNLRGLLAAPWRGYLACPHVPAERIVNIEVVPDCFIGPRLAALDRLLSLPDTDAAHLAEPARVDAALVRQVIAHARPAMPPWAETVIRRGAPADPALARARAADLAALGARP